MIRTARILDAGRPSLDAAQYRQQKQFHELIASGRAFTVDDGPVGAALVQQGYVAITAETHAGTDFYVVTFNGKAERPVLSRSGVYKSHIRSRGDARSGTNPIRALVSLVWHGDTRTSRHVANRIGLSADASDPSDAGNHDPYMLALSSLDGVDAIDRRPASQKAAHPLP